MSLAILPIAAAAALLTMWEAFICSNDSANSPAAASSAIRPRDWAARIGAALAAWAILILLLRWIGHINLFAVWAWNYRNHAAFYDHNVRTWWKWILANPIELLFGVGAPIMLAAAVGFPKMIAAGWRRREAGPYWCLTATWIVLWLSGKNMGEAARLWLVLMPWPVWLAARFFVRDPSLAAPADAKQFSSRRAAALLLIQMAVCFGTVTRVTGFDFPTAPPALTLPDRQILPIPQRIALSPSAVDANGR